MRYYETSKVDIEELVAVTCNSCGVRQEVYEEALDCNIISINHYFGYESKKDGEVHESDICENCYDTIIKNFKIPPKVSINNEVEN